MTDIYYNKAPMNLDQSTYLGIALTKKLFSRPTDKELLYETHPDASYTFYFEEKYFQKLQSEVQAAYDAGKFAKTSTVEEWNDLKKAIDAAKKTGKVNTNNLKPFLSTLIENPEPLKRTLSFTSNKISINQGLFDFSPKRIDKNYNVEVQLTETKCKIDFLDVDTNTLASIDNLNHFSIGQGGMVLDNEAYTVTIEWDKDNTTSINRIIVSLKEK